MEEVSHDLFDFSITTKTNKSLTVAEIEKALLLTTAVTELKKSSTLFTHKITDLVSNVRQLGWLSRSKTFSTAINSVLDLMQPVNEDEIVLYFLTDI